MSKQLVDQVLSRAEVKCKESGVKLTTKRKMVLHHLIESQTLLSAYDIVDRIKIKEKNAMPAMSVYRILEFLKAENLVHKIESQNKFVACSHIHCDHSHQSAQFLICTNCDHVQEMNLGHEISDGIREQANKKGFKLEFSVMEFNGLCHACRQHAD